MNNQLFKFSALSLSSLSLKLSEIERCRLLFAGIFFRPRFPLFGLWSPASDDFFSIVLAGSCLRESVAPLALYSPALIRICSVIGHLLLWIIISPVKRSSDDVSGGFSLQGHVFSLRYAIVRVFSSLHVVD
ncbi:hypothetical protein F2Q68_00026437 [Brassica cretica]|uniref:Uncharacterized protein n=1 Tax=Brassica cretica TaxID=69181 RepID=A0A8S9ICG1_BRACR|nr:hypothetical protein F2Q68_00026437 [Brassica cretica]